MGFSLFYLIFGLPLLGVPVLLHLLTRKKPVQLPFPALRFLRAKHQVRQRHRRVRHWLLLTLRILVLLVICCALIPPLRCNSDSDSDSAAGNGPGPGAVVLVFDTSSSMEYNPGDKSRLDIALFQARAVIDTLPPTCRVALIDSADSPTIQDNADRFTSPLQAKALLDGIRIRPANAPLNGVIQRAGRLVRQGTADASGTVYVFSDRTRSCWDTAQAMPPRPPEVRFVFVDVGVQEPLDLAIDHVEVFPALTAPGEKAEVRVRVRATGGDLESNLTYEFKDGPRPTVNPLPFRLSRGEERTFTFPPFTVPETPADGPSLMPRQVKVGLATADNLAFNNIRYATYLVRRPRRVLALADAPAPGKKSPAELLKIALESVAVDQPTEAFRCDVRSAAEPLPNAEELRKYAVVCLFEVVHPSKELWDALKAYVQKGGGLLLIPGGDEVLPARADFNRGAEIGLAPARLINLTTSPAVGGVGWDRFDKHVHPLTASIRNWLEGVHPDFNRDGHRPAVSRSWIVERADDAAVIAQYLDDRPALLERRVGDGKVVMLTSPLTHRLLPGDRPWHNYWNQSSFGLVLVDQVCRYLDSTRNADTPGPVNALCESGRVVKLLSPSGAVSPFTLNGPGLSQNQQSIANPDPQSGLKLPQAVVPGNFTIKDANGRIVAGFSLNVPAAESRLERVPVEELEAALGKGAVVTADRDVPLTGRRGQEGIDLLPLLLLLLVLAVVSESLFANRVSKPSVNPEPTPSAQKWITQAAKGALVGLLFGALIGAGFGSVRSLLFASAGSVFDSATRLALSVGSIGMLMGIALAVFLRRRSQNKPVERPHIVEIEEDSKWSSTPSIPS